MDMDNSEVIVGGGAGGIKWVNGNGQKHHKQKKKK